VNVDAEVIQEGFARFCNEKVSLNCTSQIIEKGAFLAPTLLSDVVPADVNLLTKF